MTSIINAIVECLTGTDTTDFSITTSEKTHSQEEDMVTSILDILYSASNCTEIMKALQEKVSTTSWTEYVAKKVLVGLENALKKATPMGDAMKDAFNKAKTEALEWLERPEVYWTIVALGVLVVLTPWVVEVLGFTLEWLGFAELGPVEGSFAAAWMRSFAGYVPKNSLFSYFQRMGMVWKTKAML